MYLSDKNRIAESRHPDARQEDAGRVEARRSAEDAGGTRRSRQQMSPLRQQAPAGTAATSNRRARRRASSRLRCSRRFRRTIPGLPAQQQGDAELPRN